MPWPDEPFLNLRQIATPAGNPQVGGQLLYVKSDGYVYTKNASGTEVKIGTAADLAAHAALTTTHGVTGSIVGTTDTQTLTNKTLTSPRIGTSLLDASGDTVVEFPNNSSGANHFQINAAGSLGTPSLATVGFDANIEMNLVTKGAGRVKINGVVAADLATAQTLTNKTLTAPALTTPTVDGVTLKAQTSGATTTTTDASGDVTITHGLGVVPTVILVNNGNNTLTVILAPHTLTSTTFKVRYRSSTTGAAVGAGASVLTYWQAIA